MQGAWMALISRLSLPRSSRSTMSTGIIATASTCLELQDPIWTSSTPIQILVADVMTVMSCVPVNCGEPLKSGCIDHSQVHNKKMQEIVKCTLYYSDILNNRIPLKFAGSEPWTLTSLSGVCLLTSLLTTKLCCYPHFFLHIAWQVFCPIFKMDHFVTICPLFK